MVYFTKGSTIVTLKDPTWPEGPEIVPRQVVARSGGGAIKVAVVGDPDTIVVLEFRNIPTSQYDALKAFLENTVSFSGHTFSFRDYADLTTNHMRYVRGIRTWKRRRGSWYSGRLELRKDLSV